LRRSCSIYYYLIKITVPLTLSSWSVEVSDKIIVPLNPWSVEVSNPSVFVFFFFSFWRIVHLFKESTVTLLLLKFAK
jgi:hypothetical protein